MSRLRSLWLVAPLLVGACSFINAPDEIDPGTGGGGSGGGTGGTTTTSETTSSSTTSDTTPPDECGDGKRTGAEGCDDDNVAAGDGCSATCEREAGFTCVEDSSGLSACTKDCGNGALDAGEECDDGGDDDTNPAAGDQDPCTDTCTLKEIDIEANDMMVGNEFPTMGFRRDKDSDDVEHPAFFTIWHTTVPNKIRGREYKFDGLPLKGTGSDDFSGTTIPDVAGHVMCTAPSNRSLVFWRDTDEQKVYAKKIESDGKLQPSVGTNIPVVEGSPVCAASPDPNTFIVAAIGGTAANKDVFVQPFTSFALPMGSPIDIGDTTVAQEIAAWPLFNGFIVSWSPDPFNAAPYVAVALDKNGGLPMDAMSLTMSDPVDVAVREPFGARIGTTDTDNSSVFGYTRQAPDMHREVVIRIFAWPNPMMPPMPGPPIVVSLDTNQQSQPRIAVNPQNGSFIVVWTAVAPGGENVLYRTFDNKGVATSPETIAPEILIGKQTFPAVAVDPASGDVAISWGSDNPSDTKPARIAAKIFRGLLK